MEWIREELYNTFKLFGGVMDFFNWLNRKVLINEIFGGFSYKLPSDRRQQMYDFYMLNYLQGRSSFDLRRNQEYKKTGIDTYQMGGARNPNPEDMDIEDEVDYMLGEVSKDMLPQLKEQLLKELFFAICAEFRHVFDRNDSKELYDKILNDLGESHAKYFKKYLKNRAILKDSDSSFTFRDKNREKIEGNNTDYELSFKMIKNSIPDDEFIQIAQYLFTNVIWAPSYGGKAWAGIVDGYNKLKEAKNESRLKIWIDHVYDLQHNTDTVFNKLRDYRLNYDYTWIKSLLDMKANSKSPLELIDGVSPQFKKLALRAIKLKYGETLESIHRRKEDNSKKNKSNKKNNSDDFHSALELELPDDDNNKNPTDNVSGKSNEFLKFYEKFISNYSLYYSLHNFARALKAYYQEGLEIHAHAWYYKDFANHLYPNENNTSDISQGVPIIKNYLKDDDALEKRFKDGDITNQTIRLFNQTINKNSFISNFFKNASVEELKKYLGWNDDSVKNVLKLIQKGNKEKFDEFFKEFKEKHISISNFSTLFIRALRVFYKNELNKTNFEKLIQLHYMDVLKMPYNSSLDPVIKSICDVMSKDFEIEQKFYNSNLNDLIEEMPHLSKETLDAFKVEIKSNKINAIKILREYLGWGLLSLKNLTERLHYSMHKKGECNCSAFAQDSNIMQLIKQTYNIFHNIGITEENMLMAKISLFLKIDPRTIIKTINNENHIDINQINNYIKNEKMLQQKIMTNSLSQSDMSLLFRHYYELMNELKKYNKNQLLNMTKYKTFPNNSYINDLLNLYQLNYDWIYNILNVLVKAY